MGSLADKRLKLDQPNLESIDTRPIKATKLAIDVSKANKIAIETSKTGKVTAVVAILKVFGDKFNNSRNANPGKSLSKPNKWLNLKKKGLNRLSKRLGEFSELSSNISKRQIVKQKNYQSSARHRIERWPPFCSKGISKVHTYIEEGCVTIVGHFKWHLYNQKGG